MVAERLSFSREEALSLAQAYTENNATSRAATLGINQSHSSKDGPKLAGSKGNQPYVDLMGRRLHVIGLQDGSWRALSDGKAVEPDRAYGYLQRSFAQQLGAVIGSSSI